MRTNARRLRGALIVLSLALGTLGTASAHGGSNSFVDGFETLGPLAGTRAIDPYEIKAGTWNVVDQAALDAPTASTSNRVLVQGSKDITPNEPMALVRARSCRAVTMQVTAAYMDVPTAGGDPLAGTSVGVVFRSPIYGGIADKDNLYLFSAHVTGITREFPTGKHYSLSKRVGRGYYPLSGQIEHTRDNLAEAHDYKIVAAGGRIQAFVDGRKIIDHVDLPGGDQVTNQDPFPGLPYDQGAVGMRTSGTRAWFDNLKYACNDAYEGRASAVNAFTQYGVDQDVKRGEAVTAYETFADLGVQKPDTGFSYHDHDFDDAVARPVTAPGGEPSIGAALRTTAKNGTVRSEIRLSGASFTFTEPNENVSVSLIADSIEVSATASCIAQSSVVRLANAFLKITIAGVAPLPDTVIGPIALEPQYAPNTEVSQRTGIYSVIAHPLDKVRVTGGTLGDDLLNRRDVSALRVVIQGASVTIPRPPDPIPSSGGGTVTGPPLILEIGNVVAGRYCS